MHGGWCDEVLGIDPGELRGVGPEHVGQHVRQILQQVKAVGHLAGHGRPESCRFRIGLGPIPHEDFNPGMRLKPRSDRRGLSVGEEGQGPPPFKVQQEGAVGVALAQGKIVHAEDLWGDQHGASGATDHPQQGVPTDGEAERLTQSDPGCPPEG
jgi:hypothetical protein